MAASPGESVIVIGAGHIGIACAHYLNREGLDVTVIDQGEVGGACSQANCGFLVPSHVVPLTVPGTIRKGLLSLLQPRAAFRVKPQLRLSLLRWMFEFGRRCTHRQMLEGARVLQSLLDVSVDEYHTLLGDSRLDCEWQRQGMLFVFRGEAALGEFADSDAWLTRELGVTARYIRGDELARFEPALVDDLAGAYFYENDSHLRPDRLNRAWAKRLIEQGVNFKEHCSLENVVKGKGRIRQVETSQGVLTADHYVFATGAWSAAWSDALECDIPVEPGKGYSVTMSRPAVMPTHPMLMPEKHIGVSPFESGYRIASMMEFAGFDTRIPKFRIQQLKDSARPFLREPVGAVTADTWYGWRPMTWDSLPIIGRLPRVDNALLAAGHNMLGLTLAPVTGKIIADLIAERPTLAVAKALQPGR